MDLSLPALCKLHIEFMGLETSVNSFLFSSIFSALGNMGASKKIVAFSGSQNDKDCSILTSRFGLLL